MKCHDAKHHLDLFMDGELSVPENLKVLEHLNLCRPCAGLYEGEKALRGVLRSQADAVKAPAGLAERLAGASAELRLVPASAPAARRRLAPFSAAAGFVLVLLTLVFTSTREMPKVLADEFSKRHKVSHEGYCGAHEPNRACLCTECNPTSDNIACRLFKELAGQDACSHDLGDLGYKPVGVEVFEHSGQPVCWTVNRDDAGHTISHGLVTTKIAKQPGPLYLCDGVDRPVVMVPAPGTDKTCVFVFDSETEAKRFRESRRLK